jgi:copper chaperone CopZ
MRTPLVALSLGSGLCLTLAACNGECSAPVAETSTETAGVATAPVSMTIVVKGMHCEGCEGAICDKVGKIAGVKAVKASHADERVEVEAPAELRSAIAAAITKLGYKIEE